MIGVAASQAFFTAFEVGEAMSIVPFFKARVFGPLGVIHGVSPDKNHPVDAAGAAQDLPATVENTPSIHVGFGLGIVAPVVVFVTQRHRESGGHVDEDVPDVIGSARFENQHLVVGVRAEAIGQHTTGRPTADDDGVVVCLQLLHGSPKGLFSLSLSRDKTFSAIKLTGVPAP